MKNNDNLAKSPLYRVLLTLYIVIGASMAISAVLGIATANGEMVLYSLATIAILFVPYLLRKFLKISIPMLLEIFILIFVFCSVTLAKLLNFYTLIPFWDLILHAFSGPLITAFGIAILGLWSFNDHGTKILSPFFIALFGFMFSMAVAGMWEFYEFGCDAIVGTEMQKHELLQSGILDTGLLDTMQDMLAAACGSVLYSVLTYFDIKTNNSLLTSKVYLAREK